MQSNRNIARQAGIEGKRHRRTIFNRRRVAHECNNLLRFSLRLRRSTRLWCIFSAILSYRAFSSFAALRSLILWIWDLRIPLAYLSDVIFVTSEPPHLSLCLLFFLQLLLVFLDGFMLLALFESFRVRSHACAGFTEWLLAIVPVFPYKKQTKLAI